MIGDRFSGTTSAEKESVSIPAVGEEEARQEGAKPRRRFVPGFLQRTREESSEEAGGPVFQTRLALEMKGAPHPCAFCKSLP